MLLCVRVLLNVLVVLVFWFCCLLNSVVAHIARLVFVLGLLFLFG